MKGTWPVEEARARFGEFLSASLTDGPQVVTRRGVETAVLVPMAEWRRLRESATPRLKDVLLMPGGENGGLGAVQRVGPHAATAGNRLTACLPATNVVRISLSESVPAAPAYAFRRESH